MILLDLLCWMAVTLAIFAITAFCAVQLGTDFDTAIFSLGLNGVFAAVYLMFMMLGDSFIYGFSCGRRRDTAGLPPFPGIADHRRSPSPVIRWNILRKTMFRCCSGLRLHCWCWAPAHGAIPAGGLNRPKRWARWDRFRSSCVRRALCSAAPDWA